MSDNENETTLGQEEVREVVEKSAAQMLKPMVESADRGERHYIRERYMPVWPAYYSILAADDQEAIMQKQRQVTKVMHWHSWAMLIMTVAIIALAVMQVTLLLRQ